MKSTIIATLSLFALAIPASAGYVLQPAEFAREFCNMRSLGWDAPAATEHAVMESMVPGTPVKVYHEGRRVDADVVVSAAAAERLCPEHY
jgi:hypothetical protein